MSRREHGAARAASTHDAGAGLNGSERKLQNDRVLSFTLRVQRGWMLLLAASWPALAIAAAPRRTPPPPTPDVILITVDTLRADRVGRRSAAGVRLTPAMDALFASGVAFANAFTTVPLTLPAHTSLMTGRIPAEHGVRDNGQRLAPAVPVIAEAYQRAGYRTVAIVGATVLHPDSGLARGFQRYDFATGPESEERSGAEVARIAAEELRRPHDAPLFLWAHLYDPHWPYQGVGSPAAATVEALAAAYDGEVGRADAAVMSLLAVYGGPAAACRRAIIVLAGDHGESLGQHGEKTHGYFLYDTTLRIPLSVCGPGLASRKSRAPASIADVPAMLSSLSGVPFASGPGALNALAAPPATDRLLRFETLHPEITLALGRWVAARSGGMKLIGGLETELYDTSADPGETRNLAGLRPPPRQLLAAVGSNPAMSAPDTEIPQNLRTLGYVNPGIKAAGGSSAKARRAGLRLADEIIAETLQGRALVLAGRPAVAIPWLDLAVNDNPDFFEAYLWRGRAALGTGDFARAGADLDLAAKGQPGNPEIAYWRGLTLLRLEGRASDAAAAFRIAMQAPPRAVTGQVGLAMALIQLGRPEEARTELEQVLAHDPGNAAAKAVLADLGPAPR